MIVRDAQHGLGRTTRTASSSQHQQMCGVLVDDGSSATLSVPVFPSAAAQGTRGVDRGPAATYSTAQLLGNVPDPFITYTSYATRAGRMRRRPVYPLYPCPFLRLSSPSHPYVRWPLAAKPELVHQPIVLRTATTTTSLLSKSPTPTARPPLRGVTATLACPSNTPPTRRPAWLAVRRSFRPSVSHSLSPSLVPSVRLFLLTVRVCFHS
ncbi:hypothetical protein PYCCODRAFT_607462 [Trametes coccinea BRFM310]|uniref:Uncharacterized protein n=1 Tax=Trametes coccinea (strain BRFM310) TaxID=1353009 RepID=A0A1Y2J245_TRAC3|nr:hypothetical protein PYCCODRAFT_607462 [Trametes coccinea BRFM310]